MQNKMSKLMVELYGIKDAQKVFNRCESLGEDLNKEIQEIAYDHFWSRAGLSMREKSLITIISLITLRKEEQIKIHINGFLNSGGTVEDIVNLLYSLISLIGMERVLFAFSLIKDAFYERDIEIGKIILAETQLYKLIEIRNLEPQFINDRYIMIAQLSGAVAESNIKEIINAIIHFVSNEGTVEDVKNIMIHQIVYCGFPSAMNGFAALQNIMPLLEKKTCGTRL